MNVPTHCTLCPRCCGANRTRRAGYCHAADNIRVARAAPHRWEEPCISGTRGSGTVFFSGCPLGCNFCQNAAISRGDIGKVVTIPQLADIFLSLQAQNAHNINLVTGTQYWPWIGEALTLARDKALHLPVVWNTGGYETTETVKALSAHVDIWLADLKFFSPTLSGQLAGAPDYFAVASEALRTMCRLSGPPIFDAEGMLLRGVVVRLLVLPGQREDAKALLHWMANELPKGSFLLSLMSQYTPPIPSPKDFPKALGRKLSSFEYRDVCETAISFGLTAGYMQQRESADAQFTPPFDGTGLP